MNRLTDQFPPDIDFSAFDFTELTDSFLSVETLVAATVGEKYLVFSLGAEFYAVASQTVAEAAPRPPVVALPNAPEWLLGIANVRGEIISVIDLPVLLDKSPVAASPKTKLVVLRAPNGDVGYAFAADKLSEIIVLHDGEITAKQNDFSPSCVFGTAVYKSNDLHLIDTEKIFSAIVI